MDLRVQGQSELDKAQLSDRDQQLNPLSPQGPGPDPSAWQSGGADNSLQRSLERLSHQLQPLPSESPDPQVLLHWGERKADKGRERALAVLEHLLAGGAVPEALEAVHWCFHACSREPPGNAERELLERAAGLEQVALLEGPQPRGTMHGRLAGSAVALLPYDPLAYAERSSGVLWLYGAARHRIQRPARVVGYGGGWLGHEVPALGLHWQELSPQGGAEAVLDALARALEATAPDPQLTPYGQTVLGGMPFSQWAGAQLQADSLSP